MKLKENSRNLFIFFTLILVIGIISRTINTTINHVKSPLEIDPPKTSYEDTVYYGDYEWICWTYPDSNDYIYWSFTGSNSLVGITVMAMDDSNLWYFENGYGYSYYSLSSGLYTSDSGTFYPSYEDKWYIVFWNNDPDMQPTYLYFNGYWYIIDNTIIVTNPTYNSEWETGTEHDINWNWEGGVSNVRIDLYKGSSYDRTIVTSTSNDGSHPWTVQSDLSDGDDYRIRVYDVSDGSVSDYSRYFSIYTPSDDTPGVPGYDFLLIISIFGIISLVLMKKIKLHKE